MRMRLSVLKGILALLIALGIVLPVSAAERLTHYHWDVLGSPVAATDGAGNLLWREDYLPYGERIETDPIANNNDRWYTGKPFDSDVGLSYLGARYYDPALGRFMGVDPVDFQEGNIHSFNKFAYANNSPQKFVDPDGRIGVFAAILVVVAVEAANLYLESYLAQQAYESGDVVNGSVVPSAAGIPGGAVGGGLRYSSIGAQSVKSVSQRAIGTKRGPKLLPAPKPRGRPNTAPQDGTIYVDSKGNALVSPPGGRITGSPDGRYIQVRDEAGRQTGTRIDAGHNPKGHPDQRAQQPHGHVPGVTNPDGTSWLPINQ